MSNPTPTTSNPRLVVVDTDGGVDDAAALLYLLHQPAIEIVAITVVWGNVDVDVACASVCRVLEAAERPEIPVALGSRGPLVEAPALDPATFIHGADGLGNTHRPPPSVTSVDTSAVELLADVVTRRPGEVSLLTLGPLSTIGDFVTRRPELASAFEQIVVMGGAARGPGNALPFGEANIAHDPGAAAAVMQAAWSRPGTLVGLDVTNIATLSEAEFELLGEHRTMTAEFLDEPLSFYRRFGSAFSPPGECPNHDLLAAMVWVEPDIVTTSLLPVEVDCGGGPAWGTTVIDLRQPFFARAGADSEQGVVDTTPRWNVALDVDIQRFRTNVRRMFGDPGGSHS